MDATLGGGWSAADVVFLNRDHYTAQGTPKRTYTAQQANEYVNRYNTGRYGKDRLLSYYKCSQCHQYHVGHKFPSK